VRRSVISVFGTAFLLFSASCGAQVQEADDYPQRTIRFVVPFAPGGPNDILARLAGQKLGETIGQAIVIDNRPGGGGINGTDLVAKATPDGYTILMVSANLAINASLHKKLPYDTDRDFAAIAQIASAPYLLVIHPAVEAKSLKEFIALAKSKPRSLNYASGGTGSPNHLAGELFNKLAGVQMVHVPYKGGGPAITDLLGGQIQVSFSSISTSIAHVRSGKLRALGLSSEKRSALVPEVPTIAEAGLRGYEVANWFGIVAPAGVSKTIIKKLSDTIVSVLNSAHMKARIETPGLESVVTPSVEFGRYIRSEIKRWALVVHESGAQAD
jgi:tripartite-type tricarboxylate transporter receptor subunit TctC